MKGVENQVKGVVSIVVFHTLVVGARDKVESPIAQAKILACANS